MYCNRCGTGLQPQQFVCPSCGQTQSGAPAAQSRLAGHVHLLAIFWFVIGALTAIGAVVLLAIGGVVGVAMRAAEAPAVAKIIGPLVLSAIGVFIALLAVISFVAGYGLLKMRPWARALALVLGFISLLHPPLGTALGIYTLIVLLPASAGQEYQRLAIAAG